MVTEADMGERTCIVSRQAKDPDELIRFVAGPQDAVVPDLKRKLPGRGVWVSADRRSVEKAAAKGLFARGFQRQVVVPANLAQMIDDQMNDDALAALSMANKAGLVVTGFDQVAAAAKAGKVTVMLHAVEAAADGMRKLAQAVRTSPSKDTPAVKQIFASGQMDLALGGYNVVHAAAMKGGATEMLLKRIERLERYRA